MIADDGKVETRVLRESDVSHQLLRARLLTPIVSPIIVISSPVLFECARDHRQVLVAEAVIDQTRKRPEPVLTRLHG